MLTLYLLGYVAVAAAPTQTPPPKLALAAALAQAHDHQPALRIARAQAQAGQGRVGQKRAPLLPSLQGVGSYQRTTANYVPRPGFVPTTGSAAGIVRPASSNANGNFLSLGLSANVLLYDFSASIDAWRASQQMAQALDHNQRAVALAVDYNLRAAYFLAYNNQAMVQVACQTLENLQHHLQQVEGFIAVGLRPEIDAMAARSDVAAAQVQMLAAQNAAASAKISLNQAMGVEGDQAYEVTDEVMAQVENEDAQGDALVEQALRQRPEFASLRASVEAARLSVGALWASLWPSLGLSAGYTDQGQSWAQAGWNWNATASLSWNVFSGGLTLGQLDEARANLAVLLAQCDAQRQQVRLEVEQARFAVQSGKQLVDAAAHAADNAGALLRAAEGRYGAGEGSILELGDAQVAMRAGLVQKVQATYQLSVARAALQKAVGHL